MTLVLGHYPIVLLLVFFRISGILLALPFFGLTPENRWGLAAASLPLTLLFCSTLPEEWIASASLLTTPGDLAFAILGEALLGLAIGAVCGIFVGAFVVAGFIAARGASLGMAREIDPVSGESSVLLAQVWRMLFLVMILAFEAHLVIFHILAYTFETLPPPWVGWMHGGRDLALLAGTTFRSGVSIALPVMVVSLLVSISMALISRMAEEFNILFLSLPFRLISALFLMGLSLLLGESVMRGMAYDMLSNITRFLAM